MTTGHKAYIGKHYKTINKKELNVVAQQEVLGSELGCSPRPVL